MTDQFERDLAQMFARRADQTEIPPVPLALLEGLEGGTGSPWRRRAVVIGLVAAAVVAAVAVPLGLSGRDGNDTAPPLDEPVTPRGLELPYVVEGELHLGDVTLPVDPNTWLQVAGSSTFVATSRSDGSNVRWQRLNGDELEAAPYLDGLLGVQTSYDGAMVAAPVGSDGATSLRVWDSGTGAVVDTIELADQPALEEPWLRGFDAAGWLYWQDGAAQKARTPAGEVVTIDTGAAFVAGVAPGGVLLRSGDSDTATVGTVRADGSLEPGVEVPVSASATWRDGTTVAYQRVGDGRVFVLDVTTGEQTEVTVTDRSYVAPVGWSGDELVVTANGEGIMTDVVAVDLGTGDQRTVFSFGADVPFPFAPIGGTGAL